MTEGVAAPRPLAGWQRASAVAGLALSVLVIWSIVGTVLDEARARFGAIAFGVLIVFLAHPLAAGLPRRIRPLGWAIDAALVAGYLFSVYWFFQVQAIFWTGFFFPNPTTIAAALCGMLVVLEATRRAWGWSLVLLVLVMVAFAFYGQVLPGMLRHLGVTWGSFVQISWYSFDGVFGRTTGLVIDTVLIFLIFGAVLERTGAGESLIKISTVVTARISGGAAHAAIVASSVFGMMSGSVAANIAGTGVFTIPMIKRQGFSPRFAAAVETAASSGGQLTPPIMAAAAFVMADLVGMPYLAIAAAALLPAVFKYLSLFAQVYAEAVRLNLPPIPRDQLPVLTRMDWIRFLLILLPVAALMIAFLTGSSPSRAGLIGVVTAIVTGFLLNPDFRRRPGLVIEALSAGGVSAGQILVAVGAIGIVLAVVNETGIGIRFALQISAIGEGNLLLALVLAMAASLILGMGLPTLPAYLIMGIMLAPALIRSGVEPVAAHLFVLYYAVYASLVPPIAYGCYIAAPIAGANPLATSFVALRISLVGLAVPFVFVYSPSLLLVNSAFSWAELAFACMQLLAAIYLLATAAGGADPFDRRLSLPSRAFRAAFGILALVPSALIAGAAAAVTLALIILPLLGLRRPRTNQN